MKVYLPCIAGYVPDQIVMCLGAFLDVFYISRRQDIDTTALETLDHALDRFQQLCEVFRIPGVRPRGFSLPWEHLLFHYRRMNEDFGAPGGVCSSITESRHKTAVRIPYCWSNRYQALGQMLLINQRLDKLAAMCSDFISRGMLPGGRTPGRGIVDVGNSHTHPNDVPEDDSDEGPVEENVLRHIVLAQSCGACTISSNSALF
jgi:hypothetical protein